MGYKSFPNNKSDNDKKCIVNKINMYIKIVEVKFNAKAELSIKINNQQIFHPYPKTNFLG